MCAHESREATVSDLTATKGKSNESSVSRGRIGEGRLARSLMRAMLAPVAS